MTRFILGFAVKRLFMRSKTIKQRGRPTYIGIGHDVPIISIEESVFENGKQRKSCWGKCHICGNCNILFYCTAVAAVFLSRTVSSVVICCVMHSACPCCRRCDAAEMELSRSEWIHTHWLEVKSIRLRRCVRAGTHVQWNVKGENQIWITVFDESLCKDDLLQNAGIN